MPHPISTTDSAAATAAAAVSNTKKTKIIIKKKAKPKNSIENEKAYNNSSTLRITLDMIEKIQNTQYDDQRFTVNSNNRSIASATVNSTTNTMTSSSSSPPLHHYNHVN